MPGNGRLVVISHGSGGSAWVYVDLASTLVADGFIVALPEHSGDNYKDKSGVGPEIWRRPAEVSRAIDAVARGARFAPLLRLDKVGMYGMSAGGHTALTLAGAGRRHESLSTATRASPKTSILARGLRCSWGATRSTTSRSGRR